MQKSGNLLNPAKSICFKNVNINDNFWCNYTRLVKEVVIPYQWEALNDMIPGAEPSHSIENFKIAAGISKGEYYGKVFQDSDFAKWLEAVAYSLITYPDEKLEKLADDVIEIIAKAQQPDGYLNTYFTVKEPDKRWTNLRDWHELYCAGHMIEAAVAYYEATGKKCLLDVMCKFADYIDMNFGLEEGKKRGYPGHEEIELALVKLFKTTGNIKYLNLSKYFIDERGKQPLYFEEEAKISGNTEFSWKNSPLGYKYYQCHLPVREQQSAEGHAVRAVYLYSGMADVARETGDIELLESCKRLWESITTRRMYITGGIGSSSFGEAFTFDYDLPNDTVYAETCASIGLVFLSHRMLLLEQKGKYADIMERALYNSIISSMSIDGTRFFYVNPLEVLPEASEKDNGKLHVKVTRQSWFACACCPPNLSRLIESLGGYIYSANSDEIFVHLYVGGTAVIETGECNVRFEQKTDYPWDGNIKLAVYPEYENTFTVALRIPEWCSGYSIKVNGEELAITASLENGYTKVKRLWKQGDVIELKLAMQVMVMKSNPLVRDNAGSIAIQRGPLVYCLEETDNGSNLKNIILPSDAEFTGEFVSDLLGGVYIIQTEALRLVESEWDNRLYASGINEKYEKFPIRFIPYYAWANRTPGEMLVWIREGRTYK